MRQTKRIMVIFGTRPEAIKLGPLVLALKKDRAFETFVVTTAQHREMLDQVLEQFGIRPDVDLNLMKSNQTLEQVTAAVVNKISRLIKLRAPNLVIVQGDTTTTMASALAAFYNQRKVAHVEAGLRSFDKYNPFPEEINRKVTSLVADFKFVPTTRARKNLLAENVPGDKIFVVGNTVIDALQWIARKRYTFADPTLRRIYHDHKRLILVTAHRRENHGRPLESICDAIINIARQHEVNVVYPVHYNPNVRAVVYKKFKKIRNVFLTDPLDYLPFVFLLKRAYLILTDSGGIQEEAPTFGVPVLVLRQTTERPEAIEAGTARLVGTDAESVYEQSRRLLVNRRAYRAMANVANPFGNGRSANAIVHILRKHHEEL